MALIKCPECGNFISYKAEMRPHCGLPAEYFPAARTVEDDPDYRKIDYKNLKAVPIE